MTARPRECGHESAVLDLIAIGQWPARADRELQAHVAACPVCAEVAQVAQAIVNADDLSTAGIQVPDAATVWYRAEARSRQERARQAARPVTIAFVAAAVCAMALAAAGWFLVRPVVSEWWTAGDTVLSAAWLRVSWTTLGSLAESWGWAVAAAIGAWTAMLPLALYVARTVDRR